MKPDSYRDLPLPLADVLTRPPCCRFEQSSELFGFMRVCSLNMNDAALLDYAKSIVNELRANMVRVHTVFSATPFKAKIANAER